jgi:hypothetical protein
LRQYILKQQDMINRLSFIFSCITVIFFIAGSANAQVTPEAPTFYKSASSASVDNYYDADYSAKQSMVTIIFDKELVCNGKYEREIRPYHFQLYPRKADNKGRVKINGTLSEAQNFIFRINKVDIEHYESTDFYDVSVDQNGHFSIEISIEAQLAEYTFSYSTDWVNWSIIATNVVCGDVLLISGQSNASAGGEEGQQEQINILYGNHDENQYGKYSRTYKQWHINPNAGWGYAEVEGSNGYGVGVWGLKLQYELEKAFKVPVCVINGAFGGTGMHQHHILEQDPFYFDFSSPPQYLFGSLLTRVYYAGLQEDVTAIIWFNGEDECRSTNAETGIYTRDFDGLYNSCVDYLGNFRQMYVIQVSSFIGPSSGLKFVSEDQRQLPTYYERLKVMSSNGIGNKDPNPEQSIHFSSEAYLELGHRLFRLIGSDLYGATLSDNPNAPNILKARKEGNSIFLDFDQILDGNLSDPLENVLSVVQFNIPDVNKFNGGILDNSLYFEIDSSFMPFIEEVSYAGFLPNGNYDLKCYLRNSGNVGALSFHKIKITPGGNPYGLTSELLNPLNISIYPNPASAMVRLTLPEEAKQNKVQLFDALGKLVLEASFPGKFYNLDCSSLRSGIYVLMITNKYGVGKKKLIIR